jgi:hypothetical protein
MYCNKICTELSVRTKKFPDFMLDQKHKQVIILT